MDIDFKNVRVPKTEHNVKVLTEFDPDLVEFYNDENSIELSVEIRTNWSNGVIEINEINYFDGWGEEYNDEISDIIFNLVG
jgi:hypothetical protein